MKTYIGIDLGGTNVRVAKVTSDGIVLAQEKAPSYGLEGPEKVMKNIKKLVKKIPNYQECLGIGIGVPGPCDTVNGKMVMSTNLKDFANYPLAAELTEEFKIPTYIDNDANVAGLAEALVGAGKGLPVVYYVTISTGIGGALIANGQVVSGHNGFAGEIANLIVDKNGEKLNHLNAGAVENEASGTAIVRKAKNVIKDHEIKHAGNVFELAEQGNEDAKAIVEKVIDDLALMFSMIAHVSDPWMFILGGGLMKSKEKFLPQVEERFKELVHVPMRNTLFVDAKLEEPGVIGAAMLPVSKGV
ncbi:MAG: ROK family protein [Erysipelotrichaceae bacterium]|nr:ROK family protein [Erysipelotrichaceae bacterium]